MTKKLNDEETSDSSNDYNKVYTKSFDEEDDQATDDIYFQNEIDEEVFKLQTENYRNMKRESKLPQASKASKEPAIPPSSKAFKD